MDKLEGEGNTDKVKAENSLFFPKGFPFQFFLFLNLFFSPQGKVGFKYARLVTFLLIF